MWPFKPKSKPARISFPPALHAKYDAAQTTRENLRHWAMADGLSADAAASSEVRKTLRQRARYEVARWDTGHFAEPREEQHCPTLVSPANSQIRSR
jgi:hypothetical protein